MEISDADRIFGRNLKRLRKERGFTQETFAEEVGKSVDTISKIERGAASTQIKTAEGFARVLGVPLHTMFAPGPVLPPDTYRREIVEHFISIAEASDQETLDAVMDAVNAVVRVSGSSPDR